MPKFLKKFLSISTIFTYEVRDLLVISSYSPSCSAFAPGQNSKFPFTALFAAAYRIPSPGEKVAERSEVGCGMRETLLDAAQGKDLLKPYPFIGLIPLPCRKVTARIPHQSQKWVPKCPFLCQLLPGRSYCTLRVLRMTWSLPCWAAPQGGDWGSPNILPPASFHSATPLASAGGKRCFT